MRSERVRMFYVGLKLAACDTVVTRQPKRLAMLSLCVAASLVGLTQPAFSLAEQNMSEQRLPNSIRNAIVRVGGLILDEYGTGIVIKRKRDRQGTGGWLCVLTADHVLARTSDEDRHWYIGFLDGDVPEYGERDYRASIRIRHRDARGKRADLAILGVYIPDFSRIPEIPDSIPIAAPIAEVHLVACGYGWHGTRQQRPNRYVVHDSFGTFRNGKNYWEDTNGATHTFTQHEITYEYSSIKFDLDFPDENRGEAHVLPGDSGGPSLQLSNGNWVLTGIHSSGSRLVDANNNGVEDDGDYAEEGHFSIDVRLIDYIEWINASCNAVPEPFSLTALCTGLLGLALCRRKQHV